jgi:hypothetical protein
VEPAAGAKAEDVTSADETREAQVERMKKKQ